MSQPPFSMCHESTPPFFMCNDCSLTCPSCPPQQVVLSTSCPPSADPTQPPPAEPTESDRIVHTAGHCLPKEDSGGEQSGQRKEGRGALVEGPLALNEKTWQQLTWLLSRKCGRMDPLEVGVTRARMAVPLFAMHLLQVQMLCKLGPVGRFFSGSYRCNLTNVRCISVCVCVCVGTCLCVPTWRFHFPIPYTRHVYLINTN